MFSLCTVYTLILELHKSHAIVTTQSIEGTFVCVYTLFNWGKWYVFTPWYHHAGRPNRTLWRLCGFCKVTLRLPYFRPCEWASWKQLLGLPSCDFLSILFDRLQRVPNEFLMCRHAAVLPVQAYKHVCTSCWQCCSLLCQEEFVSLPCLGVSINWSSVAGGACMFSVTACVHTASGPTVGDHLRAYCQFKHSPLHSICTNLHIFSHDEILVCTSCPYLCQAHRAPWCSGLPAGKPRSFGGAFSIISTYLLWGELSISITCKRSKPRELVPTLRSVTCNNRNACFVPNINFLKQNLVDFTLQAKPNLKTIV